MKELPDNTEAQDIPGRRLTAIAKLKRLQAERGEEACLVFKLVDDDLNQLIETVRDFTLKNLSPFDTTLPLHSGEVEVLHGDIRQAVIWATLRGAHLPIGHVGWDRAGKKGYRFEVWHYANDLTYLDEDQQICFEDFTPVREFFAALAAFLREVYGEGAQPPTPAENGDKKERRRRDAQRKTGFLLAVMQKQSMSQTDALDRYGGHSDLFAKYETDPEAQRYYREFTDLDANEFAKVVSKERQAQEARKKKKG